MVKVKFSPTTILIGVGIIIFILILGIVFFMTVKIGQKKSIGNNQQLIEASRENGENYQQIRRIRFTKTADGESMEILMDGTVRYYDKNGKLIKSGRRGFAETQNIFRRFEWLLNNNQLIEGGEYQIEIETQKGTTLINPGGSGQGGDIINDAIDFIDQTLNPTPTPIPSATPLPSSTPYGDPPASPNPSTTPDYSSAPPFKCSDYYTSGKPIKISNIICGPESTP
jgi:hypothetical protein